MDDREYEIYNALAPESAKNPKLPEEPQEPAPKKLKGIKRSFWKGLMIGVIVTLIVCVGGFTIIANQMARSLDQTEEGQEDQKLSLNKNGLGKILTEETVDKMDYIHTLIRAYYLHEYEDQDLQDGVISGLVNGLGDMYSAYYNKEQAQSFKETASGKFSGIGVVFQQDFKTNLVTVITVYPGSPAEKAGIQKDDILYKVNGEDVTGEDLNITVTKIKGEEGTTVDLTMYRGMDEVEFTCTRAQITVEQVTGEMKDGNIGYIAVSEFGDVTAEQFRNKLNELKSQGMEGLIIDLRDNPGGDVDITVEMLDELLPEGLAVYMMDKEGGRTDYKTTGEDSFDKPITILINGNSASASEIFTGCLRDRIGAQVVGTKSYGKGVVQSIIDLGDDTLLKLTIAEYFTPNDVSINGVGIEPDVEIEVGEDPDTDVQLEKALEVTRR